MARVTDQLNTALADRYRIERELGAGGMATVYLADDLKHDRKVALKVLRPELAAVLGAERFVQEIKTTAALQHPHILPLYDSGRTGGQADGRTDEFLYYVMPYIQGETLREKLNRETQLAIDEAVGIAMSVAGALDYAHRHGVIHRDIKPENILLHDGRAMVADFGIALAVSAAAGGRMTETGMSLGTPHYMSPEQATAEKDLSARSDVYSLGSVLYEMLAGQPPHLGGSAQQIIMKIVTEEAAPVTKMRKAVPPHVAAAVAKSLEKLPADRFATAAEFGAALENPAFTTAAGTATATAVPPYRRTALVPALAAVAIVATALAAWGWLRPRPARETSRQRVVLWEHALGNVLDPGIARVGSQATIAPDGSSIVYVDSTAGGFQLLRKLRGQRVGTPMAGTDGALSPFFAPDGRWVGYRTIDGKLRKVPIDGGGSVTVAEDADLTYNAAAWLDDGTIVYAGNLGLRRVSAAGGASQSVTSDTAERRRLINTLSPLPGSRGVLYTDCPGNCAIESAVGVIDLESGSRRTLVLSAAGAWYSPTGHLLYTHRAGGLYAMGFDLDRLEVTTGAMPIIDDVVAGTFAMAASGTVLYTTAGASAQAELVWVARDGSAVPLDSTWRGEFQYPALSPDGRALAVSLQEQTTQIWIRRADGTRQKLTQEGTVSWRPAWTPDGRSVVFSSNRRGSGTSDDYDLFRVPVDGSAPAELLLDHTFGVWEGEISPDGGWLVVRSDEANNESNIRGRRLTGDTTLVPLITDQSSTTQIALSPDGRWIAFVGDVSGQGEIYVAPFPDITSTRLVSRDGGIEPRWARSGRELFYKSAGRFIAVPVTSGPTLTLGPPRVLFSVAEYRSARNRQQYDVAPDDRHFVMIRNLPRSAGDVVYVEHWFPELQAKVGM
jgi:eukaryotic-like serine/threonine-protein kinase